MKIRNVLLSLSLAGTCFCQASAQDALRRTNAAPSTAARHIGDGVKSIGDTNRYVETTPDERPSEFKPAASKSPAAKPRSVGAKPVSFANDVDMQLIAPTACAPSCSTGEFASCGTGSSTTWFGAETLLWFSENQRAPALVTSSASGVFPSAGAAGVTTEFGGGDGIETGLLPGYRLSGGMCFGDNQKIGLGGRVYGIYSSNEQYSAVSDGSTSLGIPYFNSDFNVLAEDAYLVAFTNTTPELVSDGSVAARADLDMIGTDGSFHILLGRSKDHRIDLLAGYTYNRLKSSVTVDTVSTNRFTGDLIPDGTVFTTSDLFETENIFNGAHLGILSSVVRSRVSLTTLAKVSFGNMRQSTDTRGYTVTSFGGASATTAGGILTQASNIGPLSRDVFAFMPELGLKLGLNVRENVQLTVGYTFMFWSSVAMAGEQIDRTVDLTQVAARPAPGLAEGSFWMQGIDLGLNFSF